MKGERRKANYPRTDRSDKAEPYEALLYCCTSPDDRSPCSSDKTDGMFVSHKGGVPEEGDEPIYHPCYMTSHELKRRGYIPSKPSDQIAVLVARNSPFPEIISRKKRYHKNDNISIGTQSGFNIYHFVIYHFVIYIRVICHRVIYIRVIYIRVINIRVIYTCVLAKGTSSIAQKS